MAGSTINTNSSEAYRHDFRVTRPIQPIEWRDFLASASWVWIKGFEGDLGDAPNSLYAGAPQDSFGIGIAPDGVTITGKGSWRGAGGEAVSLRGAGRGSILTLTPDLPRGYAGFCSTGGRPYDSAVRLALLLLHRCAPGALELVSTGSLEDWQHTASLAAEILVVFEQSVELPRLVPVRQAGVAPVATPMARRRVMATAERTRAASSQAAMAAFRGYVSATGDRKAGAASG